MKRIAFFAVLMLLALSCPAQEMSAAPDSEKAAPAADAKAAAPEAKPAEAAPPATPQQESWTGAVTMMQSADRFTVSKGDTPVDVRLYGVDCPETGQPQAEEAKKAAMQAVTGVNVRVDVLTRDNLGIPVVVVTAGEINVANTLLDAGLAWWDRQNAPDDRDMKRLNAQAIGAGKGIWTDAAPLAPWDYRRSNGGEQFSYRVVPAGESTPAEPAKEEKKEEPKSISAKGDQVYTNNFTIPADVKIPEGVTPESLIFKHIPRIEKDASGKPLGLTASNISQIPYASQAGLQDGDIISKVNGIQIESEAQIMQVAPQFKGVKNFQVEIIRGGQKQLLNITVP